MRAREESSATQRSACAAFSMCEIAAHKHLRQDGVSFIVSQEIKLLMQLLFFWNVEEPARLNL
jgi:hypothetical protein